MLRNFRFVKVNQIVSSIHSVRRIVVRMAASEPAKPPASVANTTSTTTDDDWSVETDENNDDDAWVGVTPPPTPSINDDDNDIDDTYFNEVQAEEKRLAKLEAIRAAVTERKRLFKSLNPEPTRTLGDRRKETMSRLAPLRCGFPWTHPKFPSYVSMSGAPALRTIIHHVEIGNSLMAPHILDTLDYCFTITTKSPTITMEEWSFCANYTDEVTKVRCMGSGNIDSDLFGTHIVYGYWCGNRDESFVNDGIQMLRRLGKIQSFPKFPSETKRFTSASTPPPAIPTTSSEPCASSEPGASSTRPIVLSEIIQSTIMPAAIRVACQWACAAAYLGDLVTLDRLFTEFELQNSWYRDIGWTWNPISSVIAGSLEHDTDRNLYIHTVFEYLQNRLPSSILSTWLLEQHTMGLIVFFVHSDPLVTQLITSCDDGGKLLLEETQHRQYESCSPNRRSWIRLAKLAQNWVALNRLIDAHIVKIAWSLEPLKLTHVPPEFRADDIKRPDDTSNRTSALVPSKRGEAVGLAYNDGDENNDDYGVVITAHPDKVVVFDEYCDYEKPVRERLQLTFLCGLKQPVGVAVMTASSSIHVNNINTLHTHFYANALFDRNILSLILQHASFSNRSF